MDKIELLSEEEKTLLEEREKIPPRVKLSEMPRDKRYNQLKPEHKHFINIIKMISYRPETALVQIISPYFKRDKEESRMFIKQLFNTPADLIPDYENKTLTI